MTVEYRDSLSTDTTAFQGIFIYFQPVDSTLKLTELPITPKVIYEIVALTGPNHHAAIFPFCPNVPLISLPRECVKNTIEHFFFLFFF